MPNTERNFVGVLQDALVALGVDIAFKEFTKFSAQKAVAMGQEKLQKERELACERAVVLEDLRIMETQNPGSTDNLWRRYAEATKNLQENRLVDLWGKIPKDANNGRQATLKYLNDCTDERFWMAMNLLDHDWFMEWFQRVRRNLGRTWDTDLEKLKVWFEKTATMTNETGSAAGAGAKKLDDLAGLFGDAAGLLADWLERK